MFTKRNVVTTLFLISALALFTVPAQAQRVIGIPSNYVPFGYTAQVFSTTSTVGSATPVNIAATNVMVYGLAVNAGANTAGTEVWVNVFGTTATNVTPATTVPMFSTPVQHGDATHTGVQAVPIPWGQLMGVPATVGLSFNCTTVSNGATGTQVPCNANVITKK